MTELTDRPTNQPLVQPFCDLSFSEEGRGSPLQRGSLVKDILFSPREGGVTLLPPVLVSLVEWGLKRPPKWLNKMVTQ